MRWLDDPPPPGDFWFTVCMYIIAAAGIWGLIWLATGPAKSSEPPAWLVPTLVMPNGAPVTGAPGWQPRPYASLEACRTQMALARFMVPPAGASDVLWQCLPYNPIEGRAA